MKASLPTAFIAILLLSNGAAARFRKRVAEYDGSVITDIVRDDDITELEVLSGNDEPELPTTPISIPIVTLQSTDPTPPPTKLVRREEDPVSEDSDTSNAVPSTVNDGPVSAASSQTGTRTGSHATSRPKAHSNGNSTSVPSSNKTPFLRGVNLGGWLVLEKWMNNEAFSGAFSDAKDQYTFDAMPDAKEALKKHWDTFFTEADIQKLASAGINALRIPIGYWSFDDDDKTRGPYLKGADAYLEKAIGWARKAGMKVWVDCHGSPGSQNGFDNSGRSGAVEWQVGWNMAHSITILKIMAKKYGAAEYADVVVGLQLTNEPISWGANQFDKTQRWTTDAYHAVKNVTTNPDLIVVMHDAFKGVKSWTDQGKELINSGPKTFGIDTHMYQVFNDGDNAMTQQQHISKACGWGKELATANAVMPTYIGEWSAATNICVNSDGSTTAGTKCSTDGCQCQSTDYTKWNPKMIEQVRRYVEAQLDTFEQNASGYFAWSAKGPGGWGFLNLLANGAVPNPVTQRKYPGQCGGGKRRAARGMLGVGSEVREGLF